MCHGGFGSLRQHDRHTIAAPDAKCEQRVRQPVGIALQRGIGVALRLSLFILEVQRDARAFLRPTPAAHIRDVELVRDMPTERVVQRAIAVVHRLPAAWYCWTIQSSPREGLPATA